MFLLGLLVSPVRSTCAAADAPPPPKKVAVITTVYYHNSHADVIASRILQGYTLDDRGEYPNLKMASLYTDQVPAGDISRAMADKYHVPIAKTVDEALTLGTDHLAVDGVLLIAEHGDYPESETGQFVFPKRRFFEQVVAVFERTGQVVPVFSDKHLADNWRDALWIYQAAREKKIPLLVGSSLPLTWRVPVVDVPRGAELEEIVGLSYGRLDSYGYHALEMIQCLAERRAGGETGIKQVRTYSGDAVWEAGRQGVYDRKLLDLAAQRLDERPLPKGVTLETASQQQVLFAIEYNDGLRASILVLPDRYIEWAAAWRTKQGRTEGTTFSTQEWRPFAHFTPLVRGIDHLMHTGEALWPVERTLLTTGALDALLISHHEKGRAVPTPYLNIKYATKWNFKQPPPRPPDRPLGGP